MAHAAEPQHGFWSGLGPADRAFLRRTGHRVTVRPGSPVLRQNDPSGDILLILSGYAKVAAHRRVVLALRGPGDILGELAHVNGGRRCATIIAIDTVVALRIPRDRFHDLLDRSSPAARLLQRTLVDRLQEADRDRLATATMTVGQCVARMLLKLVQRYGVPAPDGSVTIAMLSQQELAACVGGATRTVVREMGAWRDRRIIATTRRSVTVYEPESLVRLAGRSAPPP
jgi:CRP/FNR family cyclic AMP-dependent transcriptional regulator